MKEIWPAWPSEHGSKEREQKTHAEGTQLKTWKAGRQERARCLAKLTGLLQSKTQRLRQID
eukprot:1083416-Pelagomonas_calceolata.AAC.1